MKIKEKRIYSILEKRQEDSSISYLIEFDFSHPVFKGHFPGKPVLPGVMMCDIIRYQVSDVLGKEVQLKTAKNIKFSRMIIPSENNNYNVKISIINNEEQYEVKAVISQNDNIYFKLNAKYKTK
jgi:3-hydroxyacyl-[acyl-carrier-protein] dehydratase